jgi:gliding motility-associated-like protein
MKDNELRDIFQNKLTDHSSPVSDHLWSSVQSSISGSVASTTATSWLATAKFWWIAAATAVVMGGATLLFVANNTDSQSPSAAQLTESNASTQQNQINASSNLVGQSSVNPNDNGSQNKKQVPQTTPTSPELSSINVAPTHMLSEVPVNPGEIQTTPGISEVEIVKTQEPEATQKASPPTSIAPSEKPSLKLTVVRFAPEQLKYLFITSADAQYFEEWEFGDGETSNEYSVSHEYETDGVYTVLMRTRSQTGELVETRQQVAAYHNGKLEMPNIFTPNGDGSNDTFNVLDLSKHIGQVNYMAIRNKDGELVYESNSSAPWDGMNTRGVACEQGSYLYSIVATDVAGNTLEKQGVVVLKR